MALNDVESIEDVARKASATANISFIRVSATKEPSSEPLASDVGYLVVCDEHQGCS
jgi:hypothetical protein